ncbi:hypothetical protein D3C84_667480 [compost metagenome]
MAELQFMKLLCRLDQALGNGQCINCVQVLQLAPVNSLNVLADQEGVATSVVTEMIQLGKKVGAACFQAFEGFEEGHEHWSLSVLWIPGIERWPGLHNPRPRAVQKLHGCIRDRLIIFAIGRGQSHICGKTVELALVECEAGRIVRGGLTQCLQKLVGVFIPVCGAVVKRLADYRRIPLA